MEENKEYIEFIEKFKAKKTTDDCYTPDNVYNAVADYVSEHYNLDRTNFCRPFYPGGDYQKYKYSENSIVVDNPPFSIFAQILKFYNEHNIKYFLFAPHLTMFSNSQDFSAIIAGVSVVYENGAKVKTSFATNLENCAFRSAPDLYKIIKTVNDLNASGKQLQQYEYPDYVVTASVLADFSKHGHEFVVNKNECKKIGALDAQKSTKKSIYGGGYLVSESAKQSKLDIEKQIELEKQMKQMKRIKWQLSDREKEIINSFD